MSVVFNFSPMAIFPIPFSTFVSSDEIYSLFFKPFFTTEYIFLMRTDRFFSYISGSFLCLNSQDY